MPHLLLKDLPRYEWILNATQRFPDLDPSAAEAYLHLLRAGDEVYRFVDTQLADFGLSQGRFTVMLLLFNMLEQPNPPATPAELAEKAGVTRATMTGLVDTLERDGFVTRHPDRDDRRMMSVRLTPKGEAHLHDLLPHHFRRVARLLAPLDPEERRTLVRLLDKVMESAVALNRGDAPA